MEKQKAILVTGASSGIGLHISKYLAAKGHLIYATARKRSDLKMLSEIDNVEAIELDVTRNDQITAAFTEVQSRGKGLYGLVNNAGLGGLGPLYTWNESELEELFDVNIKGPWRMSNAFLELLLESQGRIVNISSQGGMITQKYFGPYTMSKHALEAYTEAMRAELSSCGVQVSVVQPGGVVSNIGPNSLPGIIQRFKRAKAPFKKEAFEILASFEAPSTPPIDNAPESADNRKPSDPSIVSEAVYDALFAERPQNSYLVGTQWEGDRVLNALFKKLVEANASPAHKYSRDELILFLDKHLDQFDGIQKD